MKDITDMLAAVFAQFNKGIEKEAGYYVDSLDGKVLYVTEGSSGQVCKIEEVMSISIPANKNVIFLKTKEENWALKPEEPEF